jgi:hypothetical protein
LNWELWQEHDYNPFVLFDEHGRVLGANHEAQYLLTPGAVKEIFDLASANASASYGFKTTLFDFRIEGTAFYGLTVGYEDEQEIGVKLYKSPIKRFSVIDESGEMVNIYSLLDLCISAASISSTAEFRKDFDPTFPDLRLQAEKFTQLVGKIYESAQGSNLITTKLAVKIGEHVKFAGKKYPIFILEIESDKRDPRRESTIEQLAQSINCAVTFRGEIVELSSPLMV